MKITILGSGSWGTALGMILSSNGHSVTVWGHNPHSIAELQRTRRNDRHLPEIDLPDDWRFTSDLPRALEHAEALLVCVPSRTMRSISERLGSFRGSPIVSATKGIEAETGMTMCEVLQVGAPHSKNAVLSGPSLAAEVARGIPTAVVSASDDPDTALLVQSLFHRPTFRVYRSSDRRGVELGGAIKNVMAIAAGVCDGCGFGDNSKAALVTRGVAEMRRLGVACGAQPETFAGLGGLGDLTVTCFSRLSRNRAFGEKLGRGVPIAQALAESLEVVEGHPTARSAIDLARKHGVVTPILREVYEMLYAGKDVQKAVRDLLTRDLKAED